MTVLAVAALCLCAWAANNAVISPKQATSHKPQATSSNPQAASPGAAAITIPQMLSYQGKLTDTSGAPVPNGDYSVAFKLYTVPSGGSAFWAEPQTVTTKAGLFSVLLGSVTPIDSMPDSGAVYLGVRVNGGGAELTPRLRIASSAFAYLSRRSANSDLLQGKDTTGFVRTGQTSSVTSAMIVDGTIAAADLSQMGAATGQVMKWTGSAWAPRNDSVGGGGGGGGTVTSVSQTAGVVCNPNPITSSGTVGLDTTYSDGRYIKNQFGTTQSASWKIAGQGQDSSTTGTALRGVSTSASGYGVRGDATSYPGVYGTSTSTGQGAVEGYNLSSSPGGAGVLGYCAAGLGVSGTSASGSGVYGQSNSEYGVLGNSGHNYGVYGISTDSAGVRGNSTNSFGVSGYSTGGIGVAGNSTNSYGVSGYSTSHPGVFGTSPRGFGVYGNSTSNYGVLGSSDSSYGVGGASSSYPGVGGSSTSSYGVYGISSHNYGVYGLSTDSAGIRGNSTNSYGVFGTSASHPAVFGQSTSENGVIGVSTSGSGVSGYSTSSYGVSGQSTSSSGVSGYSIKSYGVSGNSDSSFGVSGISSHNYGVSGVSTDSAGVYGQSDKSYGVFGISNNFNGAGVIGTGDGADGVDGYSNTGTGVYGQSTRSYGVSGSSTGWYGVLGISDSSDGVYGYSLHSNAGYFNGDVVVTGNLSKGGGAFQIDHPLDPLNKYLYHSFVESPDMKNIYDGNIKTDATGYATVSLPDWFEALNRDFRYQLTVIDERDGFAQAKVVSGVKHNSFVIQTSVPLTTVSWQVTGIRQDPYANKHRIQVEVDKPAGERGKYLHPDAYGLPREAGIGYKPAPHAPKLTPAQPVRVKLSNPPVAPAPVVPAPVAPPGRTTAPIPAPSSNQTTGAGK